VRAIEQAISPKSVRCMTSMVDEFLEGTKFG